MTTFNTLHLILLICMLAFLAGLVVVFRKFKWSLTKLYLPCILFWGMVYSLVFIPFSAPDEYAHFSSAYRLSNMMMGKEVLNDENLVILREGDTVDLSPELSAEGYEEVYGRFFEPDCSERNIGYGHHYMEVAIHAYTPQAVGITLGRLLSFGQVLTIYLGRFFNLLFFALCGYGAVRLAPFGKMAFFGASLLPMTLELVSSLSYDGVAIGLGMLFSAYVMYLIYEKDTIGPRELAALGILLAALAPCKMVYIPLAAMCFLIPQEKFGSKKKFFIAAGVVAVCMVAGILLINLDKMSSYLAETEGTVGWAGDVAGYSFSYILGNPIQTVLILANTLVRQAPTYLYSMMGGSLGWLQYEVDAVLILFLLGWTALTVLTVGATDRKGLDRDLIPSSGQADAMVMPLGHRIVSLILCFGTVIATLLIMMMSWTPLGSPVVEGVQGRYFLPILPLGLVALRSRILCVVHDIDDILLGGYCLVNTLVILGILSGVYYLA